MNGKSTKRYIIFIICFIVFWIVFLPFMASEYIKIHTLNDIRQKTKTESDCREILLELGILQYTVQCNKDRCLGVCRPFQSKSIKYKKDDGWCFKCMVCNHIVSGRYQSCLYNSPKTFSQFVDIIWSFVVCEFKSGKSSQVAGANQKNVGIWHKRFKYCCAQYMSDNWSKLGGDNIIEIDESSFTKKTKYNRGRRRKDRWVFGIVILYHSM